MQLIVARQKGYEMDLKLVADGDLTISNADLTEHISTSVAEAR